MGGLFDWFGAVMDRIGSLVPRLGICRATHAGVKFRKGKVVEQITPGLYVYWPIVTEVEVLPVVRQSLNLVTQRLTTKDGTPIIISVVVVFQIVDIVRAIVETWDFEQTIGDVSLTASVEVATSKTWEELLTGFDEAQKQITRAARSALHPYGVKVEKVTITDLAKARVFAVIGDQLSYKA